MIRRVGKVKSWQEVVDGLAGRRQEKELDRHGALHDHTAASLLLGRIGVFALVDLAWIRMASDPTEEESHT